MSSKSFCNRLRPQPAIRYRGRRICFAASACAFAAILIGPLAPHARADAPVWMHAVVNAPLPTHDEKTNAVILYSEDVLTIQPNGKIKRIERRAYQILRPDGRHLGKQHFIYDSETKITNIHGWCIPAQGKDFEVKEKDMTDTAYLDVEGGELYTDYRAKVMQIPAADPGNIIGYEVEQDSRPYVLQAQWHFQDEFPVREATYTLQLPPGWEYKAVWLNHSELAPMSQGSGQSQWLVKDVPEVKWERDMPPWKGVAGEMIVSIVPPGGANHGFLTWKEMGAWYSGLVQGRRGASPEIKQQVAAIIGSFPTTLGKMQALARFTQDDVRYVAIELGIGGWQPHAAPEVFKHRFGDCKDKATLLSSMLKEIGVDSFYVVINHERGAVSALTPPHLGFDHVILAIRLPDNLSHSPLVATLQHPQLGHILFFDPTDNLTPFGEIRGELQGNFAMLVTPDGGELVQLPKLAASSNGIQRTAKLVLDSQGNLQGEVHEVRVGDAASYQRAALRYVQKSADQIKPIESLMAHSVGTFQVTKATVTNLQQNFLPFEYQWSFVAPRYGKMAGDLLLVRPRVIGVKTSDLLETKEPRKYPIELEGPTLDTDVFEITLPPGYEVDDLPAPVEADYEFASYHSKVEVSGNVLRYTRTYQLKDPTISVNKIEELKKFYRIIAGDERSTAVLKPASSAKN